MKYTHYCTVKVGWINGHAILEAWKRLDADLYKAIRANKLHPFLEDGNPLKIDPSWTAPGYWGEGPSESSLHARLNKAFYRLAEVLKRFPFDMILDDEDKKEVLRCLPPEAREGFAPKIAETEKVPSYVPTTKKARKITPLQKNRRFCREAAARLWKAPVHEKRTIVAMAKVIQESKATENKWTGKKVTIKTIETWIKDLCPDRTPGRRPSK